MPTHVPNLHILFDQIETNRHNIRQAQGHYLGAVFASIQVVCDEDKTCRIGQDFVDACASRNHIRLESKRTQDAACASFILCDKLKFAPFMLTALTVTQGSAGNIQVNTPFIGKLKPHGYKALFGLLALAIGIQYVAEVLSRKELPAYIPDAHNIANRFG